MNDGDGDISVTALKPLYPNTGESGFLRSGGERIIKSHPGLQTNKNVRICHPQASSPEHSEEH